MGAFFTRAGQIKYALPNDIHGMRIALAGGAFDTIIPSASTFGASSAGTKHPPFDVFINHRGQDVKQTLASKIYKSLDATGLKVFLDKSELKYGDLLPKALEEAMATATICIAIFSEHYAESPWCLAELEYMVKKGKTIIPIFYYVDPADLRWAVGGKLKYAAAFVDHEEKKRYAPEALQRWKAALQQASVCTGGIINSIGDEEKVVKYVVNRVKELMNTVSLEVAKHPVGLHEIVQDFDHTISLQSAGSVKFIGIWGMGGSGKTTLAKEIFNRRCSHMRWSSFLSNVRDAAGKGLLLEKQKTLLKDLDLKDERNENLDRGKQIIKNRLSRSASVLIVLDDVDHIDQLDDLLPSKDSFENLDQSLIIVTTRDQKVLQQWGISAIYPMKPLNVTHAKQLFCRHAFKEIIPRQGFEDLVEKFLNACGGLPLSLKVLGAQLCGEPDLEYWVQTLNKYSQIPHEDIANRLKVSYDALKKPEQQMFLDAACLFIGQSKIAAITAWDAEFHGLIGWTTLFSKCLVEENKGGVIRMHDHLRDLGRVIASEESPYRLWSPQQIIEILPQQEPIRVRGVASAVGDNCYERQGKIIIKTNQKECSFGPWLGLKIFFGNGKILTQEQSQLSKDLIWLQCTYFEHKNLPPWLGLKNLRILDLSDSDSLEHLWAADADALLQLRELVIRSCECFAGFPNSIGRLEKLQKVIINDDDNTGCVALIDLPQEFCYLKSLEHLELTGCINLSSLPSNFGKLSKLRHLDLNCCIKLEALPDSFKKLTQLEYLSLEDCEELAIDSESNVLEKMTKLRYLNLQGCKKLEELRLPESVSLRDLHLKETGVKELPANIFHLTNLTELEIGSPFLITLPTSVGSLSPLTALTIEGCKKLESLPDSLEHLSVLRDLTIKDTGVKCLPKSLIHLQSLTIESTPISELSFRSWGMLKSVSLSNTKVSKISIGGDSCPALETLYLSQNNDLRELETLPEKLKTLNVWSCEVLKDIRGLRGLNELKSLEIVYCEELDELPCFAELASLEKFRLEGSSKVEKIEGLEKLRSLRELSIENIDELPSFAEYTSLKKLVLRNCNKLEEIETLGYLNSLEELRISYCPELKALPGLQEITSLEKFTLEGSSKVEKIEGLEKLRSLRELSIENIDELPSFAEYTSLKKLVLSNCSKLEEIENLGYLNSSEKLQISHRPELKSLPDSLEHLSVLRDLTIKDTGVKCLPKSLIHLQSLTIWSAPISELSFRSWGMLKSVSLSVTKVSKISIGGDSCPALETLCLYRNNYLRELETLPEKLKTLNVQFCEVLKDIRGLRGLNELKSLEIYDCKMLDEIPCFAELVSLEEFRLEGRSKVEKIEGLEKLRSLRELRIQNIDELPSFAEYTFLKNLVLRNCNKLKEIENLGYLKSLEELRISDCPELKALPGLQENTSLKIIKLKMCSKLKKMEGLGNMRSLKKLTISDCLELESLPNLSKITSLEKFHLENCYKLEKIEGLERLRRLNKLKVHTRWNAPRIVSLEHSEILESVDVVANDISTVEPFVSKLQTWPSEVMICSRAVCDVGLLKSFFQDMPNVSVLDYAVVEADGNRLKLSPPKSSAIADAILKCFIIDSDHPDLQLYVHFDASPRFFYLPELGEGKWVWMGVFTQQRRSEYHLYISDSEGERVKDRVEAAWLVTGEEGSIVEAFRQHFQRCRRNELSMEETSILA